MTTWRGCAVVLWTLGVGACTASGDTSATPETTTRDSAGVTIVENGKLGAAGDLTVREVVRLGTLGGGGPEQFDRVVAVETDEAGRIYVGNAGSTSVRVFGSDGSFEAEFGGRGEGPAEVSTVDDLYVTGDTVLVIDRQRGGKAVLFRRDGTFLDSWTLMTPDRTIYGVRARVRDGWLVSVSSATSFQRPGPGTSDTLEYRVHVMDFGSDEPGPLRYQYPVYEVHGLPAGGEGSIDWGLLRMQWYAEYDGAGRLYVTDASTYRIDVVGTEGLARSVRRAFTPTPFTDDDIGAIRDAMVHVMDTISGVPDERRAEARRGVGERVDRQAQLPRPEIVPPIGALLVARDGSFWIERGDVAGVVAAARRSSFGFDLFPRAETLWDLFDPEGVFLGSVTLPARFRATSVDAEHVLGVWADDLDVEHVIEYEVIAALPG